MLNFADSVRLDPPNDVRGSAEPEAAERLLALVRDGLDAIPDASVMVFDQEFRFVLVRGGALENAGFRPHELEGHLASEALSGDRWRFYEPLYRQALIGVATSTDVTSPDGDRDFVVRVAPVHDAHGVIVGGIAVATDVSDAKYDLHRMRESEERFRLIAENASDLVVRLSTNGVIEWVSPSLVELTGWQPMEIIGRHILNFAHPDDQEDVKLFASRLREGRLRTGRSRIKMADGSYRWFSRTIRPLHDDEGGLIGFASAWRDVESEVRAERLLQESEERFRLAMETASIGMMMTAADGTFLNVNPAICHMLGYESAELEAMTFFDITHPEDVAVGAQGIKDLAAGAIKSFKQRKRYLTKYGSTVWVDLTTAGIFDSTGHFRYTVTQVVDVTTEVLNYEALQRSARQFRLLAENASDVVYQTDLGGVIQWVSPSVSHVLGWDPDSLVGVRSSTLLHADDIRLIAGLRDRLAAGEGLTPIVVRYRTNSGPMRDMSVLARNIRSDDGTVVGHSVSLRDVTDEQIARRELARSEEQFRLAMENAPHGMVLTDAGGAILQVNNAMVELLQVSQREVMGRLVANFLTEEARTLYDREMIDLLARKTESVRQERNLVSAGRELWVDHATSLQRDELGRPIFFVHQFADQTAARAAFARIEWLAHHDELTGVLNRAGGEAAIQSALESVRSDITTYGLLYLDIDNFKAFNEVGGHAAGDTVLINVASRLKRVVADSGAVMRWGGDEFLALLGPLNDAQDIARIAEEIRAEVSKPVSVGEGSAQRLFEVTTSVGGTAMLADDSLDILVERADRPLSESKGQGRNRVTIR